MSTSAADRAIAPWYRHRWPWFLIAIPATSVALGIMMLVLAGAGDPLVVDDWYKEGKTINRRIERDLEAARLGILARVEQAPEGIAVTLARADDAPGAARVAPPALALRWVHTTRAERDGAARLEAVGGGRYVAAGATLPSEGRWRLHLEPASTAAVVAVGNAAEGEAAAADGDRAGTPPDASVWRLVSETLALAPGSVPLLAPRQAAAGASP